MEYWSVGKKDLPGCSAREGQERNLLSSFLDFKDCSFNSSPLLQYSRNLTVGFWASSRAQIKATSSERGFFTFGKPL